MDYKESIRFLNSLNNFEVKRDAKYKKSYTLKAIKELNRILDLNEYKPKIFHVAGTNGKGTCATAFSSLLIANDIRTGLYTSPHILSIRERIKVDNENISVQDFIWSISQIKRIIERIKPSPTYFDVLTSAAMLHFQKKNCSWVVLETGLGGRLDSTNVYIPTVCAITSIGIDHTDKLGSDEKSIALEKAGILKSGVPVVLGKLNSNARNVIVSKAKELNCSVSEFGKDFYVMHKTVSLKNNTHFFYRPDNMPVSIDSVIDSVSVNASIAIRSAKVAGIKSFNGFKSFNLPGRFDIINENPLAVISGAHNAAAAKDLYMTLINLFKGKTIHFVLGFLKNKDFLGFFSEIKNIASAITIYPIENINDNSGEVFKELEFRFEEIELANSFEDLQTRINNLNTDLIVFSGSFYLCSQVLQKKEKIFSNKC